MIGPHEAVAIAQIAFYAPVIPLTWYIMWRNGAVRPRMAWYPMIPFSLIRLVGGILVILLVNQPDNIGLIAGALVCLNIGVVPLLLATLGMVRKCVNESFADGHPIRRLAIASRLAFFVALGLLAAGGGLSGSSSTLSQHLGEAGYIVLLLILVYLIVLQIWTLRRSELLTSTSRRIVRFAIVASPFLIVRNVYGLLYAFNDNDFNSFWSPLTGNAIVFAIMALLMEYIALWVYIYIGLTIPRAHRAPPTQNIRVAKNNSGSGQEHV